MQPTTIPATIPNTIPTTITNTLNQPGLIQPVNLQPTGTLPMVNQPLVDSSLPTIAQDPIMQAPEFMTPMDPIKSDFGKIKGLEVLTFKEAELERTLGGQTTFASVGSLQVLYFANFDRFVLSLNDWKYTLLRRIPIVSSGSNATGPIQYSLPTYNGFYTLRLNKIPHIEALQNLETIFTSNSRFSYYGTDNILKRDLSPDDRYRGSIDPTGEALGGSQLQQLPEPAQPTGVLSKKDKMKRGFKKLGYKIAHPLPKGKRNLNHLQLRDLDSMKRTSELTVPFHMYPRKEVERWISYSKEIASRNGYEPELDPEGYELGMGSPMSEGRMRGYGSVDLGQGYVSDPLSSRVLAMGITSERPESLNLYNSTTGSIGPAPSHSRHVGYTKPTFMDKVKAKLPGTHHYHGEKIEGNTYATHSTQTHPGLGDKLKTKIVGHDKFTHQGLANPSAIPITQSLYTPQNIQNLPQGSTFGSAPIYSGPAIYSTGPGTIVGPATGIISNNPVIGQTQQFVSGQPITQTQGFVNESRERIQSNVASHIPTQHVDILRGQEYLAPDQA